MPKFETEIELTLDDVWNKSIRKECDEFFFRTLDELYLEKEEDIEKVIDLLRKHDILRRFR